MDHGVQKVTVNLDGDLVALLDRQRSKIAQQTGLKISMGQIVRRAIRAGLAAYEN